MPTMTRTSPSNRRTAAKAEAIDWAEVAQVAYELFQRRGCAHGFDQQDWFEAEQVVRRRRKAR